MRTKLVLRLIWAFICATLAAIYSQLIPPIEGANPFIIRGLLTTAAALSGYMVFSKVAHSIRIVTMTAFNFIVHRVSSEVSSQIIRFPRPNFPFAHPTPQVGSVSITKPLILDTSSIIDGRILDIAKTGFLSGLMLVPKFVLTELQQVADSSDNLKRQRGRKGFEAVEELKKLKVLRVEVWDKDQSGKNVDEKLVNLAKGLNGRLLTTDFNLNKLASISNVIVLNVNDLANALKAVALPGEKLDIKIVHLGKDRTQGIGYLPDGTMVVVADSADNLGKVVKVEVTKNIQNPAGRMIFGKTVGSSESS